MKGAHTEVLVIMRNAIGHYYLGYLPVSSLFFRTLASLPDSDDDNDDVVEAQSRKTKDKKKKSGMGCANTVFCPVMTNESVDLEATAEGHREGKKKETSRVHDALRSPCIPKCLLM